MSLVLYRLGGIIARHRWRVIAIWCLLLVLAASSAAVLGNSYNDDFSIPGTQSQQGQDILSQRFGQSGASGEIVFVADFGKINSGSNEQAVADIAKQVDQLDGVAMSNPLDADSGGVLSPSHDAVIGSVRFDSDKPSQATLNAVVAAAKPSGHPGLRTSVGGSAYGSLTSGGGSRAGELIGLLIAFGVLALTFGSFVAAGMPLITSIIGVGATISGVILTSHFATISSTSPTLAEMLGLAVGIDYALFILSRHRTQLAEGIGVVESMQRALATAGTAVVFAGITVIIALCGLSIVGIPILSVMGFAAAAAVVVAVCSALTLLPAIALLLGRRLVPRAKSVPRPRKRRLRLPRPALASHRVRLVTRVPLLTVIIVVVGLGLLSLPAFSMSLALTDNSTAPPGSPQRVTYDLITREFGPGYNAPLSVTADVITSTNPKQTVSDLANGLRQLDGVAAVTTATPNQGGDTALIQVIPEGSQNDPQTADLVQRIRNATPHLEQKYDVSDLLVTGQTAVNIDVSARLAGALLPFGAVVVGLSLILLMVVFRSIAVPIKATAGYLLSVGTSLGAVVWVFQEGHLPGALSGMISTGPIVSFLPIFVMGVLFGLAMDYEMFLVSRMREAYVRDGDPRQAITGGFRSSAKVVTAAAMIMTSVFAAFVPGGTATIMPIAFGLAVGVLTDAFVVRMTLVPAILALLGRRAWWLPRWLDRALPVVDIEGESLQRLLELQTWQAANPTAAVRLPCPKSDGPQPTNMIIERGSTTVLVAGSHAGATSLALMLGGRSAHYHQGLAIDGLLVPEQQEDVRQRTAVINTDLSVVGSEQSPEKMITDRAQLASVRPHARKRFRQRYAAVRREFDHDEFGHEDQDPYGSTPYDRLVTEIALAVAGGADIVILISTAASAGRDAVARLMTSQARSVTMIIITDHLAPSLEPAGIAYLPEQQFAISARESA